MLKPSRSKISKLKKTSIALGISQALAISALQAATITVNDFSDVDGSNCTLRQAIEAANTDTRIAGCLPGSGTDLIQFSNTTPQTIILEQGALSIRSNLTLQGGSNSFNGVYISGTSNIPAADNFDIGPNVVSIENMTIANARDSGVNIRDGAIVKVTNSTVSGNTESGITSFHYANDLTIERSTITANGNTASIGGGVFSRGIVEIIHSTISGNTASIGGGIYVDLGKTSVLNSTIVGNTASNGGGVETNEGSLEINDSIVSGNMAGAGAEVFQQLNENGIEIELENSVIGSSVTSYGDAIVINGNFSSNQSFFATNDRNSTALDQIIDINLSDNGGQTLTHNLVTGSPALQFARGTNCIEEDQRYQPKTGTITLCDAGAVEFLTLKPRIQVNVSCSFEQAIESAMTNRPVGGCDAGGVNETIEFEDSYSEILLNQDLPTITSNILIKGNGNTINGNGEFSLIQIRQGAAVEIDGITLTSSDTAGFDIRDSSEAIISNSTISNSSGSGIMSRDSNISVNNTTISSNSSRGINSENSNVVVDTSTISSNGGGILSERDLLTINNSTISNNIAAQNGRGAGMLTLSSDLTMVNTTVTGNEVNFSSFFPFGAEGGGLNINGGTTTIRSSLIAGNQADGADGEISSGLISISNSLLGTNAFNNARSFSGMALTAIEQGDNNILATGEGQGTTFILPLSRLLGPLNDNGGPTQTHALVFNSPALNAAACPDLGLDQRGLPRDDGFCDIGAVEAQAGEIDDPTEQTCFVIKAADGSVINFCL